MKYILGVDAGNTKTIALVALLNGKIVGQGRGGCGDIYNAGSPEKALQNVDDAIQAALLAAKCSQAEILVASFSMAGADWPEDFELLRSALLERNYAQQIEVVNDAVGALRAGAIDDWGVAIVNGTGAGISARSLDGQLWHSSWWQEGGGARSLGENALRAIYRAELGLLGKTTLTERILAFYGFASVADLLHHFTKRLEPGASNVPDLARLVLDQAHAGDAVAREIVLQEGTTLGDYALAAARKVGIAGSTFPLVLAGSVFKHESPLLIDAILERIRSQVGHGISVLRSELEPSAGALVMSLQAAGMKVTAKIRSRLKATMPPPEFFAT